MSRSIDLGISVYAKQGTDGVNHLPPWVGEVGGAPWRSSEGDLSSRTEVALRQGGGGRFSKSEGMQVLYERQVLQRRVPEKSLAEAQKTMQATGRRTTR